LAKILSRNEGVLISNDQYDLILLGAFNIPRKVIQLVHDPYNVTLSLRFHDCIDKFIVHSRYIFDQLIKEFPDRRPDIHYIPYGISIPKGVFKKQNLNGPLKLLFLGRHDKAKGVFDLIKINSILKDRNIEVLWTILGKGPETLELKTQWENENNVKFHTPNQNSEILSEVLENDVLVFPTKFEGFPVALLEAMSMGCVPVVTDLPGGIRELIEDGVNGYKCPIDENVVFAEKIIELHKNREKLFVMQLNAMEKVSQNFDAKKQSPKYQELFKQSVFSNDAPRHHAVHRKIGSRLDQPWLPNSMTSLIRKIIGNNE
jgi:glycosyltransferase involved in cell wall biosynthesis